MSIFLGRGVLGVFPFLGSMVVLQHPKRICTSASTPQFTFNQRFRISYLPYWSFLLPQRTLSTIAAFFDFHITSCSRIVECRHAIRKNPIYHRLSRTRHVDGGNSRSETGPTSLIQPLENFRSIFAVKGYVFSTAWRVSSEFA
jgi:hypothetical protein